MIGYVHEDRGLPGKSIPDSGIHLVELPGPILGIVSAPRGQLRYSPDAKNIGIENTVLKVLIGEAYSGSFLNVVQHQALQDEGAARKILNRHLRLGGEFTIEAHTTKMIGGAFFALKVPPDMTRSQYVQECKDEIVEVLNAGDAPLLSTLARSRRLFVTAMSGSDCPNTKGLRGIAVAAEKQGQ